MIKVKLFYLFFPLLVLSSCVQHQSEDKPFISSEAIKIKVEVKYAEGFEVDYEDGYVKITTRALKNNDPFSDSLFILTDSATVLNAVSKSIAGSRNRLACQSSTHLAFLDELSSLDQVVGLCGIEYVNNSSILEILSRNEVIELCSADQIELEAIYQAKPDLFLVYPFGADQNEVYNQKGIQTLLVAEYLEESQLARLEWIKLFGLLSGRTEEANAYFQVVEKEYFELKGKSEQSEKTFIMNLPFSDQWFMPSSKSVGVELIEDAGIQYYYKDQEGTENMVHSNEQVWQDGIMADYWIIVARRAKGFGLEDLKLESPVYKEFKAVQNKQVIFCNTAEVDYFSKGVIEPHIILKDLLFATGQIESHIPTYFFRLE